MLIERAAADIEVTDDDLLNAAVLGDVPEILGSVLAEAVTDREDLEGLGRGDRFGGYVAAGGAGEGLYAVLEGERCLGDLLGVAVSAIRSGLGSGFGRGSSGTFKLQLSR